MSEQLPYFLELDPVGQPDLEDIGPDEDLRAWLFGIQQENGGSGCYDSEGCPIDYPTLSIYFQKWGMDAAAFPLERLSDVHRILCSAEAHLNNTHAPCKELEELYASVSKVYALAPSSVRESIHAPFERISTFITSGVVLDSFVSDLVQIEAWYEEQSPKEALVEKLFHVKQEYNAQCDDYRRLGWLKTKAGKEGIEDKKGVFYPLPTLDQVYEVLSEQLELLRYKANQGFTRFVLVPLGLSYVGMYTMLGDEYARYQKDPALGLYRSDAAKTKYEHEVESTWFSDTMKKEENVYYYPETLSEGADPNKHKGKTKKELITSSRFPGWEIHILHQDTTLPREGAQGAKEQGGRVPLPANVQYRDQLAIIQGKKNRADDFPTKDETGAFVFQGEVGLIPEVWVSLALQKLRQDKQLLHDFYENSSDCAAPLTGMLTKQNSVPLSSFFASSDDRQVELNGYDPNNQNYGFGFVSSVKVC